MSELPKGWVQIVLGEALQVQKGKKPIGLGPKGEDRSVPYINISAFETKQLGEYAPEQDVPRCQPSDTLMVWDGARAGLAGRGVGGFIGSTLARLTSDLADSSYLYYFVHSNYRYLNTHTKGVGIPHIDPIALSEISFLLPPAAEQTRIVAKLEELLSDLDAGVAELKAAQKKLAQYRQSLLKAAVEGALTAPWRAEQRAQNKPVESGAQLLERILKERRTRWEAKQLAKFEEQGKPPPKDWQKKYPEPVQPDTNGLPELPEGWVWASAEMLLSWGSGDFLPASAQIDGSYPVYGGNGINGRHNAANVDHSTIVIGRVGVHCGNVYLSESSAWVTDNAIYATSKHDRITWPYAELVMQAARLGTSSKGGAQPFISQKILNDTIVALPPVKEQGRICDEYSIALNANVAMEQSIDLALKQSTAQRQNILRAAFAGQLVQQDPNDEPASVLLERIRAERAERAKQPKTRKTKPKEIATMVSQLIDVLAEAGDWVPAQEAFRRCGVANGALTERIEELYAELRKLDKSGRLAVEAVTDAQGRKLYDKLKLLEG